MVVWDPDLNTAVTPSKSKGQDPAVEGPLLGASDVPAGIIKFRNQYPDGLVISTRERPRVCRQSDYVGSTEYIINIIKKAAPTPAGWWAPSSTW